MRTRYKPIVFAMFAMLNGQHLQAQNPNLLSDIGSVPEFGDQLTSSAKTLDDVRASMRMKRKPLGAKARKIVEEYKLMVGDEISLNSNSDSSIRQSSVHVLPDGNIIVPLLKAPVPAAGKTFQALRKDLEIAYEPFIVSPAIDILPVKVKGNMGLEGGDGAGEGGMSGYGGGPMGGGLMGGGMGSSGGMMSSGGSSMGVAGGSSSGADGGFSGMGRPSSEKQKLIQLIQQLRERLKSKKYKREDVEKLLRSVLADYFQLDLEERVGEFDKVKARIAEMESKLQNRLDRQKEIIELQTLQILHKADGLDFVIPGGDSGSGFGNMGMGSMGLPGSSGMGMSGPGGMSGPPGMTMGPGGSGGRDDLFGSGSGGSVGGSEGLSGGISGDEMAAEFPTPVLGYDIGFNATKYLRLDGGPTEPNDPLVLFKFRNSKSPVGTTSSIEEKMKSILNAMHEFHEIFHHLPGAANRHVKGQPPHSWRVALLPLLGHSDLYREYRFDEPWDSPSNSKLILKIPNVYSDSALTGQQTNSTFFVIIGEESAFPLDRPTSMSDITDGTSNTIGIVRVTKLDIPWTKPEDIEFNAAIQLLSPGNLVGTIDGVVFKIPANPPRNWLRDMITRSGGEIVDRDLK